MKLVEKRLTRYWPYVVHKMLLASATRNLCEVHRTIKLMLSVSK